MERILIAYYSRKGENCFEGEIKSISKGNTEIMAEYIQKAIGGDLFEIETVKPYAESYKVCLQEAKRELRQNARPELKRYPENLDKYDTIFVGYPNWWGTCPMAVLSFFEHYVLAGKRIIPFCTNEGSGMGNSEHDLEKVCVGAVILHGLPIYGSEVAASEHIVSDWAKKKI